MPIPTTKVTQILDAHKVSYRVLPHCEPVFTVAAAAQQRGVIAEEMVISILLHDRQHRYVMAGVLGHMRLAPRAVRAHLPDGWQRLSFATADEILAVTGFVQGAVAPLGLPPNIPVIFDQAIAQCSKVNISSGDPMAGIELAAADLIRVSHAEIAAIALLSRK